MEKADETGSLKVCRICLEEDKDHSLLSPCLCSGSHESIHQTCLKKWLVSKNMQKTECEICKEPFVMKFKNKVMFTPFKELVSFKTFIIVSLFCILGIFALSILILSSRIQFDLNSVEKAWSIIVISLYCLSSIIISVILVRMCKSTCFTVEVSDWYISSRATK